jgi:hypothetical protein
LFAGQHGANCVSPLLLWQRGVGHQAATDRAYLLLAALQIRAAAFGTALNDNRVGRIVGATCDIEATAASEVSGWLL